MKYDINVTLKPLNLQLEIDKTTSCEEMHDTILEEVYRKLDSHNPEVELEKVCLRMAKEDKSPASLLFDEFESPEMIESRRAANEAIKKIIFQRA